MPFIQLPELIFNLETLDVKSLVYQALRHCVQKATHSICYAYEENQRPHKLASDYHLNYTWVYMVLSHTRQTGALIDNISTVH